MNDADDVNNYNENGDPLDTALERQLAFNREVSGEVHRLAVREAAREQHARSLAGDIVLPPMHRLADFLAVHDPEVTHRIAGLWPSGGRVVLSAAHKAGKTTAVGNLLRCLADATPFLDVFSVQPVRRIVLLDNELDENMLRRWLRDQGVRNVDAVELVTLRGRLSTFNILDPSTRALWAEHIGPADAVIFDCLRPALDALGLDEDKHAGRFLEALDEFTAEARIAETFVVHHMGHNGERSRGDSRIQDWPDAVWKLVKDKESDAEEDAPPARRVYFSAYGRDVDQPEVLLTFDADTRHLSVGGGSRTETRAESLVDEVLEYVTENPGASKNLIEKGLPRNVTDVRKALNLLVQRQQVSRIKSGRAHLHWPISSHSSDLVQDERTNPRHDLVPSSIGRGRGRDDDRDPSAADLVPDELPIEEPPEDPDECPICHRYTCDHDHREAS